MNNVLQFLTDLREGSFLADAENALREVEEAISETGKAGSITFSFKIEPVKGSGGMAVQISADITARKPKVTQESTLLFRSGNGRFSRRDPRQPELPTMRAVPSDQTVTIPQAEAVNE